MPLRKRPKPVYPARPVPILKKVQEPVVDSSQPAVITPEPAVQKDVSSGRCGLPNCMKPVCMLISHRLLVETYQGRRQSTKTKKKETGVHAPLKLSLAYCDNFPGIFIDGVDQQISRRLWNDYFTRLFERFHAVMNPPRGSSSNREWMEERKRVILGHQDKDHIDCLSVMVLTWGVMVSTTSSYISEAAAVAICGRLLKLVRQRLDNYTTDDSARLLMIIYTLVSFDTVIGRTTALPGHRQAMIHIVNSRGGLHNHGHMIAFIISLDRTIAMQLDQTPVYQTWESVNVPIQRPARYPFVYGSFFDRSWEKRPLDPDILVYCTEVCRAIEILEGEDWIFEIDSQATPETHYLFYLRDRLTGKYVHLNARHSQTASRDRCVLHAAKLVEYITLTDNMSPALTSSIAENLRQVICLQDLAQVWKGWGDVFRWIVCVLVSIPHRWRGKGWAAVLLHSLLEREYGDSWPLTWQQDQIRIASSFVWSDTRLNESFMNNSRVVTEVK